MLKTDTCMAPKVLLWCCVIRRAVVFLLCSLVTGYDEAVMLAAYVITPVPVRVRVIQLHHLIALQHLPWRLGQNGSDKELNTCKAGLLYWHRIANTGDVHIHIPV